MRLGKKLLHLSRRQIWRPYTATANIDLPFYYKDSLASGHLQSELRTASGAAPYAGERMLNNTVVDEADLPGAGFDFQDVTNLFIEAASGAC
jgi:hypothetical protein